jgi:class 3 adenylate cyclase
MLKTKNLSIMFTDMKGFTARTSTHSRQQLNHLLELQDELIKPAIKHFDGKIVKTIGDAFLVAFESPTDGVLCGMKIQENVINHNVRAPSSDQIEVRIAINSGEVNIKDDDVFGEPVNIASRIEAIAEPNEVYFTESVYLSMNKNEIPTAEVGHRKLKGIPEEIKVYKVVSEQTNLIRAKLKRQEQASATANLTKDEIHTTEKNPQIQEALEDLQEEGEEELANHSLLPEKKIIKIKKSFWNKHKKKFIIAFIIFLVLVIISIANEKKELAQELTQTKYPLEELKNKMPEFQREFDKAVKDNEKDKIIAMLEHLKSIIANAPPELKPKIKTFAQQQLKNPDLNQKQKQDLQKLLDNL